MTGGVKVTVWRSKRTLPPPTPQKATATLHTLRFFHHDDGKEKKKVILSVSSAVCVCVKDALDRDRERKEKVKDGVTVAETEKKTAETLKK